MAAEQLNPLLVFCFGLLGVQGTFFGILRKNRAHAASLSIGILLTIGTMFLVIFRGVNMTDEVFNSTVSLLVLGSLVTLGYPFVSYATKRKRR